MDKERLTQGGLFKNKDFLLLFLGGFVSRVGNGVHHIALVWFILELTGSGTATGILMLLSTLPGVLVGPFSGLVADRVNRKILIVGNDVIRGLLVIWLGWTVYSGAAGFFHLASATVLIAISSSFFNPAVGATLPNLVSEENLQRANSMEHFSINFTQIIGAALGGILISLVGIAGVFFVNGVTFLVSAFSELFIDIPPVEKEADTKVTFLADFKFGLKYLYGHKLIFTMFGIALFFNFLFNGLAAVGLPYIFKEILGLSSSQFGFAQSIFPAGAIVGSLIMSVLVIKNYYRLLIGAVTVQSSLIVAMALPLLPPILSNFALSVIFFSFLGVLFLFGTINAVVNVPLNTLLQRLIPDNLRGRIFGLIGTMTQALTPISMALIGFLIDQVPVHYLFIGAGVGSLLLTLIASQLQALKELKAPEMSGGEPAKNPG